MRKGWKKSQQSPQSSIAPRGSVGQKHLQVYHNQYDLKREQDSLGREQLSTRGDLSGAAHLESGFVRNSQSSQNTQKLKLSECLQDRDGGLRILDHPTAGKNRIDLRQSVITDDALLQNTASRTTATARMSMEAGFNLQDQKKKMVEQFQMSVMRNELKNNVPFRRSSRLNAVDNSVSNEADLIKLSLTNQTDSITSSKIEPIELNNNMIKNQINQAMYNQLDQRGMNKSDFLQALGGSQTQRIQQHHQVPALSFIMSSNHQMQSQRSQYSLEEPGLRQGQNWNNNSVEVLQQGKKPQNSARNHKLIVENTPELLEDANALKRLLSPSHEATSPENLLFNASAISVSNLPHIRSKAPANDTWMIPQAHPFSPLSSGPVAAAAAATGHATRPIFTRGGIPTNLPLRDIYKSSVAQYTQALRLTRVQARSQRDQRKPAAAPDQSNRSTAQSKQLARSGMPSQAEQRAEYRGSAAKTSRAVPGEHQALMTGRERQDLPDELSLGQDPELLQQQQRFQVNKAKKEWNYEPSPNEFTEDMIEMSGGNVYHQGTYQYLNRFISGLQGNIVHTNVAKVQLREHSQKIFDIMKDEKRKYLKTLLKGESEGHCKGISKRLDQTTKIRMKQEIEKRRQAWEAKKVIVKAMQAQREEQRQEARKKRIQQKLAALDAHNCGSHGAFHGQGFLAYQSDTKSMQQHLKSSFKETNKSQSFDPGETLTSARAARFGGGFGSKSLPRHQAQRKVQINIAEVGLDTEHNVPMARGGEFPASDSKGLLPAADDQDKSQTQHHLGKSGADLPPTSQQRASAFRNRTKSRGAMSMYEPAGMPNHLAIQNLPHGVQFLPRRSTAADRGGDAAQQSGRRGSACGQPTHRMNKTKAVITGLKLKLGISCLNYLQQDSAGTGQKPNCDINRASELLHQMEESINEDEQSLMAQLHTYFKQENILAQKSQSYLGMKDVKQDMVRSKINDLNLINNEEITGLFRRMSLQETNISKKHARLNRNAFKQFLEDRYSKNIGEKLMIFLETQFNSLYRADIFSFIQMINDMLYAGPECYKKMLFACMSISNNGRICEHDLFQIMEQYKQRDSFFFYQELIQMDDVPRDYKNARDQSDDIFYSAFVKDMKVLSQMINVRKRMAGLVDMDTVEDVSGDFDVAKYPGTQQQYEHAVMNQIQYMITLINRKGGQQLQFELLEILAQARSLQAFRNQLCAFVARNSLVQKQPRRASVMSKHSQSKEKSKKSEPKHGAQKPSNIDFFSPPVNVNPCINTQLKVSKKLHECVHITFEDFCQLFSTKRAPNTQIHISSLAEDLVRTITCGKIDLKKFEDDMSQVREIEECYQKYQTASRLARQEKMPKAPQNQLGTTQSTFQSHQGDEQKSQADNSKRKKHAHASEKKQSFGMTGKSFHQDNQSAAQGSKQDKAENNKGRKFRQLNHRISEPYQDQDQPPVAGEFQGKFLIRKYNGEQVNEKNAKKAAHAAGGQSGDSDADSITKDQADEKDTMIVTVTREAIIKLFQFKFSMGLNNFFNIFHCFYMLSKVPRHAQNNPFALYMDEASVVRGFHATFGIDCEEVAIRFYKLFLLPPSETADGKRMKSVDLLRFYEVIHQLIDKSSHGISQIQNAFKFYDYDDNESIGSVDIVNLLKHFPEKKIEKIFRKHTQLYEEREAQYKRLQEEQALARTQRKMLTTPKMSLQSLVGGISAMQSNRESSLENAHNAQVNQSSDHDQLISSDSESGSDASSQNEFEESTNFSQTKQTFDSSAVKEEDKKEQSQRLTLKQSGLHAAGAHGKSNQAGRKQGKAAASAADDPSQLKIENHAKSKEIKNPWNSFLMEVKLIRDYFVKEVATQQGQQAADPNFFNIVKFQSRFLPMIEEQYKINTPAIANFFRHRLIVTELKPEGLTGYHVEQRKRMPMNVYFNQISDENLDLAKVIKQIGIPESQVSPAFVQMITMLNRVSIAPRGHLYVDTSEFDQMHAQQSQQPQATQQQNQDGNQN